MSPACQCECDGEAVDFARSDFDDGFDDYEDPPLYRAGRIAAMTDTQLVAEARRQCRIHDSAIDRCEPMGSLCIENAAGRLNICEAECKRRGIEWLWPTEAEGGDT
jgi:hypothetical protein